MAAAAHLLGRNIKGDCPHVHTLVAVHAGNHEEYSWTLIQKPEIIEITDLTENDLGSSTPQSSKSEYNSSLIFLYNLCNNFN